MADMQKEPASAPVRKDRFASGLVIYVWVMLILIGLFLGFLYQYLGAYESSLPEHCVEAYQASLHETVPAAALRDLQVPDELAQSGEEKTAFLASLFQEAELKKDYANSREYHRCYRVVTADGQELGTVVFEPIGGRGFGLQEWAAVEEHYGFSFSESPLPEEPSLPGPWVEAYEASLRETVPAAAFRGLDPAALPQSDELKTAFLASLFRDAVLQEDPGSSQPERLVYRVLAADGQELGAVVFEPLREDGVITPEWAASEEQYDFSSYYRSLSVTVPSDYRVYLDDQLLGSDWIRQGDVGYDSLLPFLEEYALPEIVRYEGLFLGEAELRVLNEKDEALSEEQLTQDVVLDLLDRCPEEARELIDAYLPSFIDLYIHFSADIKNSAQYYYSQLKPLVVPDSSLYDRMHQAFEGMGYSATRDVTLISHEAERIMDLGGGRYAVELRYVEEITGSDREVGPVQKEQHILLVLVLSDGQVLAEALYYL